MPELFTDHRQAALALINRGVELREKEGNFLGGIAYRREPMTEKQANWLRILLQRHNLPALQDGGADA